MIRGSKGPYPYHEGEHLITAIDLRAFADESGIQAGASHCLMLGYIASERKWRKFRDRWRAVLTRYEVNEFHSTTFFGRTDEGERLGDFVGWSRSKALKFLEDLGEVLNTHRLTRIGTFVEWKAFNALSPGERRLLTGGFIRNGRYIATGAPTKPYYFVFMVAILDALNAARSGATVHFVFDRQQDFKKHAINIFNRLAEDDAPTFQKMGQISFASRLKEIELQAADLLNYSWYSTFSREVEDIGPERRKAIQVVTEKAGRSLRGYEGDTLHRFMRDTFPPELLSWIQAHD